MDAAGVACLFLVCLVTGAEYTRADGELMEAAIMDLLNLGSVTLKVRPPEPVVVTFNYQLLAVTEVNLEQGYIETSSWPTMQWTDVRLAHASNVSMLHLDPSDIWTPDIVLYNAVSTGTIQQNSAEVISDRSGSVFWVPQMNMRSACDVIGQLEDGDSVNCTLKFGSWTYNGFALDLQINPEAASILSEYHVTGKWGVVSAHQERQVQHYACCLEPLVDVLVTLTLQRRTRGLSSRLRGLWK